MTAALHQAAARLLTYPDSGLYGQLPLLRSVVDAERGQAADSLTSFLTHAEATPQAELARHYVKTFDFKNRRCLYLTWWTDGDTRRRGMALVHIKQAYRAAGLEYTDADGELPDFLPAVLEFTARAGDTTLLQEHRPGLELLRLSLTECGTPYAQILQSVCRTLPGASPKDMEAARAMARKGPPREDVGLTPYGRELPLLPVSPGAPR
ncbi:nitrate reductase molybdenum cofactor assembly chaperone [Streptomyces fractus]|uniref:nitrate reductase molybdenum cofactor assembly chaperone n=1 Tax=Streptomyces fractus TaxID=641806 RepID=UPI003CF1A47B